MTGYWVRDLMGLWHKATTETAGENGGWLVLCLASSWISVDKVGIPGAGAPVCPDCMDAEQRMGATQREIAAERKKAR